MTTAFIITITGMDKANLIKELAKVSRSAGGEWLKTKLIRIQHQFAAMVMVSVEQANEAELKSTLEKSFPKLHFLYAPAEDRDISQATAATLVVDCQDRAGLTQEITKALSDLDLKVENMDFRRLPVTPVGGTVYTARMTVLFPDEASKDELVERLESIADCTHVNFE